MVIATYGQPGAGFPFWATNDGPGDGDGYIIWAPDMSSALQLYREHQPHDPWLLRGMADSE